MAGPWEKYGGGTPAPAFIPGTPKPVSPVEQTRLDLSIKADARAEEAAARAAAAAEKADKRAEIATDLAISKEARDATKAANPTESERTAAFLATRVAGSSKQLREVVSRNPDAASPEVLPFIARGLGAETIANYMTNEDRQAAEAAQLDLVDSLLTLGTGAAYTKEQIEAYRRSFFPQLGDGERAIADKKERLRLAFEAAKVKAGRAAPQIEEAMIAAGYLSETGKKGEGSVKQEDQNLPGLTGVVTDDSPGLTGGEVIDDSPIDPNDPNGGGRAPNSVVGGLEAGAGDVVEFLGETLGLVANPLNSGINALTGSNLTTDMGQTFREASGLRRGGAMAEAVNKGGLAAMTGTGIARGVGSLAGQYGMPVAEAVAGRVAATPGRDFAAGMSAGAGGQLAQDAGFGLGGQIIGGLAGGLGGYRAANRLANAGRSQPNALAMAAQRQGVDLMPADAGGTITKRMSAGAVQMPIASGQMVRGAERSQTQMREATSRIAASQGDAAATDIAGQSLATAAKGYISRTSARASNLYDKAEQASKGVRIKPTQTTAVIDDQIARLRELPDTNASFIKELEKLKNDIKGGVKISGLRDARSALSSGTFDGKLRSGREKAVYKQIVTALSDDMTAGLQSVGRKDAAMMFAKADKFWQQRVQHIDEVLEPIVGKKKGGEEVIASIEAMARGTSGGNKRLSRLLGELNPKEAGNVRAVVIDRIGRATAGAQDDTGSKFSAATFLTNWNKMTPQAKSSLFGSSELRSNLDDIAKLASAMKTTGRFANTSQTAGAINAAALGTAAYAHPILGITMAGGQYATGKLLSSPAFARWLAKSPKTQNPQALKTYVERLELVASREPLIAADARQLQQQLIEAISPTRLAADEKKNEAGGKPPAQ